MRLPRVLSVLVLNVALSFASHGGQINGAYDTGYVVINTSSSYPIYGLYSSAPNGTGILGEGDQSFGTGIYGRGWLGVHAEGASIGLEAEGDATGVEAESNTNGVVAYSDDYIGTGVLGFGYYGIYGQASGVGGATAGYFEGDVAITGTCYPCVISDEKVKKNILPLGSGLNKIMALRPKSYEMKVDELKDQINLGGGRHFGLIAQDVEGILPEVVHSISAPPHLTKAERRKGVKVQPTQYKSVNYTELIPILIQAIQEQQIEIEKLKKGN